MTAWHEGPMLAFDLETTGPDPDTARIVTATLIALDGPNTAPRHWVQGIREYLVNPGVDIPAGATAVHGITTTHARENGMNRERAVAEIIGEIGLRLHRGIPVVAYNGAYDLTVLDREARRLNIDPLTNRLPVVGPMVDPYVLDKQVDKYRKGSRKLVDVADHDGIDLRNAHTSQADALAAAQVGVAIAGRYPELVGVDLPRLHTLQTTWRREQCASLQAYFRRKDPTAVVNGDWPVQSLPAGWDPAFHPVDDEQAVA